MNTVEHMVCNIEVIHILQRWALEGMCVGVVIGEEEETEIVVVQLRSVWHSQVGQTCYHDMR
jgi:hypothetical protein